MRAGGNWENPGTCLTLREVVHTTAMTMYMPYFRPGVWGGAAHLWDQTGSRSKGCGSRGHHHAGTERKTVFSAWLSSHP